MRRHADEFRRLDAEVLFISFGTVAWARAWLEETASSFPLLLDPDRSAYLAYGLRSTRRLLSLRVIWQYVRLLLAGRRLRPVQGDPHQAGGDFVIDSRGVVRLAYRSQDAADYPPVDSILDLLRRLVEERRTSR